jgi:glycosyltransferase involved in cell wall biosynthesis
MVTIVTITYNSSKFVKEAIESVLSQSYSDFEYLISDDCSTDNTWEIIQEYKDPRIRAWRNEKNIGEYPNRNKTLFEAKGDYILWIDGDDLLMPLALSNIMFYIKHYPQSAMIMYFPYRDNIIYPIELSPVEIVSFEYFGNSILINGFSDTIFNKRILMENGGLPEKYIAGDLYIKTKISLKHPSVLIPDSISWWRYTPGQASEKLHKDNRGYFERFNILNELLYHEDFPLNSLEIKQAKENLYHVMCRKLITNYFLKLQILTFIKLMASFNIKLKIFACLIKKPKFDYSKDKTPSNPFIDKNFYKNLFLNNRTNGDTK